MDRRSRLGVIEGLARIREAAPLLGEEAVPIAQAWSRVLAGPVRARFNVPRFACSAMDGYALRSADTRRATADDPVALLLNPPLPAGGSAAALAPRTVTPISTGAPVPPEADAILVREKADLDGSRLVVRAPVAASINVRAPGEDIAVGAELGRAGNQLDAERIGMMAAAGIARLAVRVRPRLAYFSTGDELVEPGAESLSDSAIVDANRPMVAALAQEAGVPLLDLGHARDSANAIAGLIERAGDAADILVSSGGVSAGAFDLVRSCIEASGGEILFHGLEMRPGKPLLFARLPSDALYFGLPGNPVAALVGFRFFVLEAVRAMLGLPAEAGRQVARSGGQAKGPTRFLRVRVQQDADGSVRCDAALDQRSHILSSVAEADGWLRVDDASDVDTLYPKRPGRLT